MPIARKDALLAMLLAFLFLAGSAGAGDISIPLRAEKDSSAASGTASLDGWSTIMVVRHPTDDPADMKNMAPALSAGIPANP